jgi:hypothetical protein
MQGTRFANNKKVHFFLKKIEVSLFFFFIFRHVVHQTRSIEAFCWKRRCVHEFFVFFFLKKLFFFPLSKNSASQGVRSGALRFAASSSEDQR